MRESYAADRSVDREAEPGVCPDPDDGAGEASFTLEVDGEVFKVREDGRGGSAYDWTSGPNAGYGFGLSPTTGMTLDEHRQHVRDFLQGIDPATGYLRES